MRLRYASVLFQETENFMEAEETLSKGVCKLIITRVASAC